MKLTVYGVPAPQGSKTRMPNGHVVEGSSKTGRAKHKAWRAAVTETAREAWGDQPPMDGPLMLIVGFRFPMPASRRKPVQQRGVAWHAVKPDIDKVLRATVDGLTDGGAIRDDARIAMVRTHAFEVVGWTGCELWVRCLDDLDLDLVAGAQPMTRRDFRRQAPITRQLHMSHYARHPTDAWFAACVCGWRSDPLDSLNEARRAWTSHAVDTLRRIT